MTKVDTPYEKPSRATVVGFALLGALTLALAAPGAGAQMAPGTCGELRSPGQVGPYDYRTIPRESKYLVETAHFTPNVESLVKGSSGYLGGDIDYTLRAIPNHPRALLSMLRLTIRLKGERVQASRYTMDCYFDRAFRMAPDDPMPHVLFANYLKWRGKSAEAKRELDTAESLRGNPTAYDLDYNLGLLYFDLGEYDKAAVAGKRAYALGASLPALRNRLKARGKSVD